jgi:hypothetical protein
VSFFRGLFGRKGDPLQGQAETLVDAARINATGFFIPLLDKFPILRDADIGRWDFFLTIAGVFIAATRLRNLNLETAREEHLMAIVSDRLVAWDSAHGLAAFEDCKSFFERTFDGLTDTGHEPRYVASDSIGAWIIWNIFDRAPKTEEERQLTRAAGVMIVHVFHNWWSTN